MSFNVDPSFKKSGSKSRKRQTQRKVKRAIGALGGLLVLGGLGYLGWVFLTAEPSDDPLMADLDDELATPVEGEENFEMVQMEGSAEAGIIAARAPFIDIPKDPMILYLDQGETLKEGSRIEGPRELAVARVGPPRPDRLGFVRDDLVLQETRLVTTIPSSREDLAFFQAARSQGLAELDSYDQLATQPQLAGEEAESGDVVSVDGADGSWGELIETETGGSDDTATYVETQIENTTSVAFMLRENERRPLYEDHIIVLQTEREIAEVLESAGLTEDRAARAVTAMERLLQQPTSFPPGSVVAIRLKPELTGDELMQMSLYNNLGYVGTLAQVGAGRFATGADPWIDEDLLTRTNDVRPAAAAQQDIRLLDAIYSAAIRNGLSTTMVGELIVMMSQSYDLDRFAAVGDKVTILYATDPGPDGQGAGQILYAGLRGPSGEVDCFVVKDTANGGYSCFGQGGGGSGEGGIGSGMIIPVSGTKTSDFGPRMHPILRQLRNHNGVDWAAPTGTPIHAAADGTIALAGNGGGYGNVVYIDHSGGRQTRYAHLNRFADGIRTGVQVRSGDVIGYVGTTGRSTGPHLHFELRVNGNPVDPLTYQGVPGGSGGTVVVASRPSGPASGAVEALVNQIIMVESAGNANAANPRSTAVGLGQFIQSTWIRMMETYRPDLVQSMSRADLLALRTNPELSREMVTNLARENEAFLRARGHGITPGRLYLAHFLGPGGAHTALSSNPNLLVSDVMGEQVVRANPFLRGDTIGELWAWADRKMGNAPSGTVIVTGGAPRPRVIPPEVQAYMDLIKPLIEES